MKSNAIIFHIILFSILIIAALLVSCKDNSTEPTRDTEFKCSLIVKDTAGNPVNGLRVSACGVLTLNSRLYRLKKMNTVNSINSTSKIMAQTILTYELATQAQVRLSVFNLDNQEIDTLVNGLQQAGIHSVSLALPAMLSSGVYKCVLTADSGSIHFRDSIYAVCHNEDAELNVLGYTSSQGSFKITNKILFPAIYDIPPLIHTMYDPTSLGLFFYTDSVEICLTDTATHNMQFYYVEIEDLENTFNLTWNPMSIRRTIEKEIIGSENLISAASDSVALPVNWKLYQNYPNPFE